MYKKPEDGILLELALEQLRFLTQEESELVKLRFGIESGKFVPPKTIREIARIKNMDQDEFKICELVIRLRAAEERFLSFLKQQLAYRLIFMLKNRLLFLLR